MIAFNIPCAYWDAEGQECQCENRKFLIFQDRTCPKKRDFDAPCEHFINLLPIWRDQEDDI